jgi:hypothetical protein
MTQHMAFDRLLLHRETFEVAVVRLWASWTEFFSTGSAQTTRTLSFSLLPLPMPRITPTKHGLPVAYEFFETDKAFCHWHAGNKVDAEDHVINSCNTPRPGYSVRKLIDKQPVWLGGICNTCLDLYFNTLSRANVREFTLHYAEASDDPEHHQAPLYADADKRKAACAKIDALRDKQYALDTEIARLSAKHDKHA